MGFRNAVRAYVTGRPRKSSVRSNHKQSLPVRIKKRLKLKDGAAPSGRRRLGHPEWKLISRFPCNRLTARPCFARTVGVRPHSGRHSRFDVARLGRAMCRRRRATCSRVAFNACAGCWLCRLRLSRRDDGRSEQRSGHEGGNCKLGSHENLSIAINDTEFKTPSEV
jgi:hypothetical protein